MIKLHIFDMDNTLLEADCDVTWKEFLVSRNYAPHDALAISDRFMADYDAGCLDHDEFIRFQLAEFAGRTAAEMAKIANEHFEARIRQAVRPKAFAFVKEVIASGTPAVMLTSTNAVIARPVAMHFGFSEFIGAGLEMNNGVYTGNPAGVYPAQQGKVYYLGKLCERHNIDASQVTAYGDSINDAPLLSMTGKAVAVSPSASLLEIARKNNWQIENWSI